MKIMCKQEYYNQVVQYAESIKDLHCRTAWNVLKHGKRIWTTRVK